MVKHVRQYLDVSTAHLTEQDNRMLSQSVEDRDVINMVVPLVREYEYGHWVWVPDAEDIEFYAQSYTSYGLSETFVDVLRYARKNNCDWVNFDRDAEPCEDLPTHDW